VRAKPFYFEIKDVVAQFIAAFDDIVISRFNKNREEEDQINVRYLYAPKQRVMHDIINENKTITLPAVAVNVTGVTRDTSRVFNKIDGFYYSGTSGEERTSKHIKPPVPVNINLSVSVLARYQTDMDQILSNFIPFTNPYVVISWYVPKEFGLTVDQEIRSEVLWDGNVSLNYPVELVASQKARITADTSFTIKGWLFKDEADPVGNIFFIDQNFHAENIITDYEDLSSTEATVESFELSGSPFITDIFYNGVLLQDDLTITANTSGNIILNGYGFNHTKTVLFSTNNESVYTNLTSISGFSRQEPVSGQSIPFTILNDNTIIFNSPLIAPSVIVAGAGDSRGNGTYLQNGTIGGKPSYTVPNTNKFMQWNVVAENWQIGLGSISLYYSDDDVATPDLATTWLNFDGFGTLPVPSVVSEASKLRFIPLNKAGYDFSDLSYMDTLRGRGLSSTFIIVE